MNKKITHVALCAILLVLHFPAEAQQAAKVPRIRVLGSQSAADPRIELIRQGFRDLGYLEGKNVVVEYRYAEGKLDRFPGLVAEAVRENVDSLVVMSAPGALAAKNATKTIPIIMFVGIDPVAAGLVESFARPGGNITGFTSITGELGGKRLELFKEAVPKLVRVAVLYDPANPGSVEVVQEVRTVARPLGLTARFWEVQGADNFEKVFAAMSKERTDGLVVAPSPLFSANVSRITDFALKSWLPSMFGTREFVDAGGLMTYRADNDNSYRRVAIYVDKILKGTKPADLPVERPMKFEFIVNLKTAKQIGVTVPPNVLARADRVIR
jgi:putative ABC transport system substrate-binding protein